MKKLIALFILCLCLLSSCNLLHQKTPITQKSKTLKTILIPLDSKVKKGTLSNGMTYYVRENSKPEQKVELRLVVKAGSILENEKQLGLAHFMEHMNFNGSKNFNKNQLVDYLQSIGVKFGAHLNAYTSFDETVYILPIPTDDDKKLEKGLLILEDWAFNASLTDKEIEKERGVVLEEYRLGLGADKRMLSEYLPKLLYNSHYAKRLPIGTKKVLETFTYDDLRSFYKNWYRPDLMAIVAVGNVSSTILEAKIKKHFSKYKNVKNKTKRKQFSYPNHEQTLVSITTDKEASNSSVRLFYKDNKTTTPATTVDDYKKNIIQNLFSNMLNNRLDDLKNSEKPPFIYAGSWYSSIIDTSKKVYQSFAMSDEKGQLKAFKTLVTENERVLRYGFIEPELSRAKKSLFINIERAFKERNKSASKNYASEYIQNFLTKEPYPGVEWEFETLKKILPTITLENCNNLIKKYIHTNNRVVVFTGPEKKHLSKITEQQILDILNKAKSLDIKPYTEKKLANSLLKTPPDSGSIVSIKKDTLLHITELILSNGAKVRYKKTDFKDNEILFSAFSYGGTSLYNTKDHLKTSLANNALTEAGINNFSKNDLKKILIGKSVKLTPFIGLLSEGFKGGSTPKDLETLFQLTHLYFTKLNYDEKAYNSYQDKLLAYLKNLISKPSTYFSVELNKFLNKQNPRFIGFPTKELIKNTNYKLAYTKYNERFADAGDFNFYFTGNFDEKILQKYCKTYLASLPNLHSNETYKKIKTPPLKGVLEKNITKGKEPKSFVKIIYNGLIYNYKDKDDYYLKSLGEALTIKLTEQLREEESGVYGVSAKGNIQHLPYKKYSFTISFPCGPENVEKLKQKAIAELNKIKENGISEKDLTKIKETQLLEYKEILKENSFWLNIMKDSDFNKKDIHLYLNKKLEINKLTSENLKHIANKFLTKNRIIATLNPEN